jgi:hypothetical protein
MEDRDFRDWDAMHTYAATGWTVPYEFLRIELWDVGAATTDIGRVMADEALAISMISQTGERDALTFTEGGRVSVSKSGALGVLSRTRRREPNYTLFFTDQSVVADKYNELARLYGDTGEIFFILSDTSSTPHRGSGYFVSAFGKAAQASRHSNLLRANLSLMEH